MKALAKVQCTDYVIVSSASAEGLDSVCPAGGSKGKFLNVLVVLNVLTA